LQVARFASKGKLRVAVGAGVNKRYLGRMYSVLHSRRGKDKRIKKV
jgi:hypothetical protein